MRDLGPWRRDYKSPIAASMEDAALALIHAPPWALATALGVLGAIFGSFIAALVVRWSADRSVLRGRSACDSCGKPLGAHELVPVLSAIASHGKCRSCGAAIDPTHWRIEAMALALGIVAGLVLPGAEALATAVFGWLLLALAALDITDYWLPDELTATLAIGGVVTGLLGIAPSITDRLIGGVGGLAALWAIGAGYKLIRHRDGLGGGDPKLLGAIGLWLGWQLLPVVLFLAALTGLAVVLFRLLTGRGARLDDRLPLGALMAIAAYPAMLVMLGMTP